MKKIYLLGVLLFGSVLSSYAGPCSDSYATITVSECESYVSPSGKTFISSGSFLDTIPNSGGCDSIITIQLTVPSHLVSSTLAGVDYGHRDGTATEAWFNRPSGTAVDGSGNIYICDTENHRIRKVSSTGVVSTIAGSGNIGFEDGNGTSALFYYPSDIVIDASNNLYVSDRVNNRIRKIDPSGNVTTYAGTSSSGSSDGLCNNAQFYYPRGLAIDASGNIYVADQQNHRIRKISTTGTVTTLAGSSSGFADGTGTSARFNYPDGIDVDASGNVYVADQNNNRIRKITPSGVVSTYVGSGAYGSSNGTGTNATLYFPTDVAVDGSGNLYIAEPSYGRIRKVNSSGVTSYYVGGSTGYADGTGTSARFYQSKGLSVDGSGNLYVADEYNNVIRKVTTSAVVTTHAGAITGYLDGTGTEAQFDRPNDMVSDASGNIYVADTDNHRIRKISPSGVVTTLAGSDVGFADGTGTSARFQSPNSIDIDASGNLFVADGYNNRIRKVTPTGVVTTFAGTSSGYLDGTGTAARFNYPNAIAIDGHDNIYVWDYSNHRLRKITPAGVVTTIAGNGGTGSSDGTGTSSSFYYPSAIAADYAGNVYVADGNNRKIRMVSTLGVVTTLAGNGNYSNVNGIGSSASFTGLVGIEIDNSGNLYASTYYRNVRKINILTTEVTTVAGSNNGEAGTTEGTGTQTRFLNTIGLCVDGDDNVYVLDGDSRRVIRKLTQERSASTSSTFAVVGCDGSYTSPSGKSWTSVGTYLDTIPNVLGCDSFMTISVSFASPSSSSMSATISTTSYMAPSGKIITSSGSHKDTITNMAGCDSIITISLTITGTSSTLNVSEACEYYKTPSGKFWTTNRTANDTITNDAGSDSVITISLTFIGDKIVSTIAGNASLADGPKDDAVFRSPRDLVFDGSGNMFIADADHHLIRKVSSTGYVTTVAGSIRGYADGTGTEARFNYPSGIAIDGSGNLYVSDHNNYRVRKITPSGVVTTLAGSGSYGYSDGTGTSASFKNPRGIAIDASNNLFVADENNHRIRKITPSGVVTTFAGSSSGYADGTGTSAQFSQPRGVTIDGSGNLYVADFQNQRIRKITSSGVVSTFAGSGSYSNTDGTGTGASFYYPTGITYDGSGNLYISSYHGHAIRQLSIADQVVNTIAGNYGAGYVDGKGASAQFRYPLGLATDGSGNVYVADEQNHAIRQINNTCDVTTYAGQGSFRNGSSATATFNRPAGLTVDESGNIYIADIENHSIRKISSAGVVTTLAGSGAGGYSNGTGTNASFYYPYDVAVDKSGNVYVADRSSQRIRKITSSGVVTTIAGSGSYGYADGNGESASFRDPQGIVIDDDGNLFVSDSWNHVIRKISPSGDVTTIAGYPGSSGSSDGTGTSARFYSPRGIAIDIDGNIYVGDQYNSKIRKVTPDGVVSTLPGYYSYSEGLDVDASGTVYTTNSYNNIINVITSAGSTSVLAGSYSSGSTDGIGTNASFHYPSGLALDNKGDIYISDNYNNIIRKISTDVFEATEGELEVTAYNSYTSPSGNHVFTETGTYMDTIANANGCDSVITIDLTVNRRLFVDAGMGSSGTGGSWGTSFKTLKEALDSINNIVDFDERIQVWVKSGTYYAGGNQGSTNRNTSYVVTNPKLELYGGFSGVETNLDQRNTAANPTVLCGDIGKAGDDSDNAFHVIVIVDKRTSFEEEPYNDFVLDGLIIKDGNADGNTKYTYHGKSVYQTEGGAIAIIGSGVTNQHISPTISNCHFENNYSDYGAIYITAPKAQAKPLITNCTFKGNRGIYGTIFNDGQAGEASPSIVNCAFDSNSTATSGAAIYNYGYAGKANPVITSCVFNNNSATSQGGAIYNSGYAGTCNPVIFNCTFYGNSAGSHGGVMYSFGASGTCQPKVTNSISYKNSKGGDDDHKFSEFYNYQAYPYVSYSSLQRGSSTYSTSSANGLNGGTNNVFNTDPKFEAMTDGNGTDNVWRTGDDGLRLSSASSLLNAGTNTGASATDILGNQRMGTTDIGAFEYVNCGLNVKLATSVKTHVASQTVVDDGFVCYCNSDNELLLALDTNGTGAVITPSQVQLFIGNPSTLSYNSSGGMITNTAGGVILERRWDVDPTTQPTSPVRVRYFYTNNDYNDIVTAMAGLTSPTAISSPSQLQFYKVTGGSTATFPNPHDAGVYGIVLTNSTTASTTTWVGGTHGVQDHTAEYMVNSFSGGGGGGGGGSEPLPVELIEFTAQAAPNHSADLTWKTASELNNSHFVVERTFDGITFEEISVVQGFGTTQEVMTYNLQDVAIDINQNTVFYRLIQVDFDGTETYSPIRRVDFDAAKALDANQVTLYPNPTKSEVTVAFTSDEYDVHRVKLVDQLGRTILSKEFTGQTGTLDLSHQATGIYFVILDSGESFKVIKE